MKKVILYSLIGIFSVCMMSAIFSLLIFSSIHNEKERNSPQELEVSAPTKTVSKNYAVYDIGMTEETFRTNYNNFMNTEFSGMSLHLQKAPEYHGKNANVYEHYFSDNLSLLVSYDPVSNKVKGLILGATPNNELDAINMISVITGLVSITSPDLSAKEKRELLQSLGMFREGGHTDYRTIEGSRLHNNITYAIKGNGSNGVTFFVCGKDVAFGGSGSSDSPHDLLADLAHYLTWLETNNTQNQIASNTSNKSNNTIEKYVQQSKSYNDRIVSLANQCNQAPSRSEASSLYYTAMDLFSEIGITSINLSGEANIPPKTKDILLCVLSTESERARYLTNALFAISHGNNPLPDYEAGGRAKEQYDQYNQQLQALLK